MPENARRREQDEESSHTDEELERGIGDEFGEESDEELDEEDDDLDEDEEDEGLDSPRGGGDDRI